ncbi:MAG TPA: nuclear transport factor 2 family protein [Candidatus Tumulicola sp.]
MDNSGDTAERNREIVAAAFERWRAGTGSLFELLAQDARCEIVGNSTVSGTYHGRDAFVTEVLAPFGQRVSRSLIPSVRRIYADGDSVIALYDGESIASDGVPYRNTYAWFLRMDDGKIAEAVGFYDSIGFNEFWSRVAPKRD